MPKLSIITINFNNLKGLKRTVESVVNQTWKDFEYIIVDGGSTDGSAEYIEKQNTDIDYWISESDKGIYHAMNKGIAKATGEYLLFLNSGDHLNDSSVLKKNYVHLKDKEIVCFNIKEVRDNSISIKKCPIEITFEYMVKDSIPHQSTFIRKSLFEKIGLYDQQLKIVSDWKFFIIALGKYNATYLYVDDDFSTFYIGGISSHIDNYQKMLKEKEFVISSDFSIFRDETKEYFRLKEIVYNLRKSSKINWLIKFGLLNEF
ncbi:glycosyltransferase family 2 protein [Flavobacterium cellulosilyticum]|uniref:Glycosyltransferase n=1 Tax=Flavobacterium cellulosilyticum TaxID=2541731 RepID=A0A4R5CEB4_9FLAO|nr:glycosyltransferase family 2 protein [Flavobacterium cellulosilyticum]TDD98398.1 glycosyltransferase [Flavobacterium cellulosilyticum]